MPMQKDTKKILRRIILSAFFVFIIIFGIFNSRDLIWGIRIKNVTINDLPAQAEMKISGSATKITGVAKHAVKLSLNDREISIDQKGNFEETIALFLGYNVVNIKAQDKFGSSDEKNYKLIY